MYYLDMSLGDAPLASAVFADKEEAKAKLYGLAEMLAPHNKLALLQNMHQAFEELEAEQHWCYVIEIAPFDISLLYCEEEYEDVLMN